MASRQEKGDFRRGVRCFGAEMRRYGGPGFVRTVLAIIGFSIAGGRSGYFRGNKCRSAGKWSMVFYAKNTHRWFYIFKN
ncbi:hypothetical protein DN052_04510 [Acidithiobacillus ferrooxidans]|jgi:hypothetical protein|uniref:Uncharacterized protein n=1 Tax=Acidithiobacillus ferrooxidans TaxID=920 RepID=A0A2W1KKC7_ACIFR|nr:hypothetical protein DN052_04510 [Acidithiobacillus ferrooxidans]